MLRRPHFLLLLELVLHYNGYWKSLYMVTCFMILKSVIGINDMYNLLSGIGHMTAGGLHSVIHDHHVMGEVILKAQCITPVLLG